MATRQRKRVPDFASRTLIISGSLGVTRTPNLVVNSHPLCRLSYQGIGGQRNEKFH